MKSVELSVRMFEFSPQIVDLEKLVATYGLEENLRYHIARAKVAYAQVALAKAEYACMMRAYLA